MRSIHRGRTLLGATVAMSLLIAVAPMSAGAVTPTRSAMARSFTVVGSTVYFAADDGEHGIELWKTDGSAAGTRRVKDIRPAETGSDPWDLVASGGLLYFTSGTRLVRDIRPGSKGSLALDYDWYHLPDIAAHGRIVYFAATDGVHGTELWRSDGTRPGTRMVKDINATPR